MDNHMVSGTACTMDLSMVSVSIQTTDTISVLSGSQGHQHGFQWQPRPPTSTWPLVAAQPTTMNMGSQATAQTMNIHKAFGGNMGP